MGGVESWLDVGLIALLAATLLHAIRLQRAISALRGERESLDDAVAGFDTGARQAEAGLAHLRDATARLGKEMVGASSLKDDLAFLIERGAQVADRLESLVRASRTVEPQTPVAGPSAFGGRHAGPSAVRSQAERDLLLALQGGR
jgi:hypothetical protein